MRSLVLISAMIGLSLTGSGCALGIGKSLHQYSTLDYTEVKASPKSQNSKMIEVEGKQDVIIATGNTEFADEAYRKLLDGCPGGNIVNVTARHSTDLGILGYQNKMKMTGYCQQ